MHHLTRFFSPPHNHHSKKEKEEILKDPKHKMSSRSKPKLKRINAGKNIEYEASSSLPSSATATTLADATFPFAVGDQSSLLTTRSLDLASCNSYTSFRIGGLDGEIEQICKTLGLSGPDDFNIPTAAWEARKARSSSELLPKPLLHQSNNNNNNNANDTEATAVVLDGDDSRFEARVCRNLASDGSCSSSTSGGGGGGGESGGGGRGRGGINGVRPPLLAPPPSMLVPILDHSGSTWDLVRAFAPDDGTNCSNSSTRRSGRKGQIPASSSDEEQEEEEIGDGSVDREDVNGRRLGESVVLSDSSSFSTSNDDDCSSTTTEHMFTISPNGRFRRNIRSWTKGELLGSGSFGTVYEGLSDDGFFFAVKEVSLLDQGGFGRQSIDQLDQEISLLSQFEHENIVQYLGTDKDEAKLYIFLELVPKGSLAQLYQKYNLQDSQVSAYTRQILRGLKYLHDRNIVHRDIKCANILVDTYGSVKLADFGLAKTTKFNDVKSCKGTAFWMAPEVVKCRSQGYGLAADIWSLGCTVIEMLTRRLPYYPLEGMQAVYRIGRGEPPSIPNYLSGDAQDFIRQCLQTKPDNRPTAAKLLEHAFVTRSVPASGSDSPYQNNWRPS